MKTTPWLQSPTSFWPLQAVSVAGPRPQPPPWLSPGPTIAQYEHDGKKLRERDKKRKRQERKIPLAMLDLNQYFLKASHH